MADLLASHDQGGGVLAILAPGQGAQREGFLTDWLTVDGFADRLAALAAAAEVDLVAAGTTMTDVQISDTAIAQPLIVGAGLATLGALSSDPATAYAGHSVGEFTAAAAAGVVDEQAAMRLIAARGTAMAVASAAVPSGMAAVLGGDDSDVLAAIAAAGCVAANFNGAGQIVAAGRREALDRLVANPPVGARIRPLAVAGAFHSDLMVPARDALQAAAATVAPRDTPGGVVSNRDGQLLTGGTEILGRLVDQVCLPVRWDACLRTLASLGVTAVIELPPAGTLTALVRRALPGVETLALRSPDDLDAARELVALHSTQPTSGEPEWRLLVAPEKGTVRLTDAGNALLHLATRDAELAVCLDGDADLLELLVHDGDPVTAGQPLARVTAR
jgi:[acyl-carrier-protein] S-malonyltransferase